MDPRAVIAANAAIAAHLRRAAELLEQQDATPYRAQAFRGAAATIAGLDESVVDLVERAGAAGLLALPGVGRSIAAAVAEMVRTGHWDRLDHLTGAVDPEDRFRAVPGIGPVLAREIHERLGIESLSDLEAAAWDGRLAVLPGLGPRRLAALRASLASVLERTRARPPPAPPPAQEPPAALLLDVDHEYRTRAEAGSLPRIAPKRFNPTHEPWLPILHTARGRWRFTALWSNTRRAPSRERAGQLTCEPSETGKSSKTRSLAPRRDFSFLRERANVLCGFARHRVLASTRSATSQA